MSRPRHWAMAAVGAAGLAAALAGLWLTSRAVLALGGSCAEGGPYVVATECPDGVAAWGAAALPAGFAFGGLLAYGAHRVHGPAAFLPLLGWPVLFLTIGANFLVGAAGGTGDTGGWIVCGVVFLALGAPAAWVLARPLVRLVRERVALAAAVTAAAAGGLAFALALGPGA